MKCILVSHSHWDREWYRTFQAFRARLVDLIDRVLDLVAADPAFRFLLDGQTVVLEDYLDIRPGRRAELEAACRGGRLAIGPWYVQPDSLLPSGESHVRNLLEGRRVGAALGPVSRVAYCPDSFGHPAQLPQLFRGFGLSPFVYWRGSGDELDTLPAEYLWEAPDGSAVLVHHLAQGYFSASNLHDDPESAARWLARLGAELTLRSQSGVVLLMNGFDHALPDAHAGTVTQALARMTGWTVVHGLLEDFAALLPGDAPRFRGELVSARSANLLPGVWSARLPLKLRNRRGEAVLEGWAEPWAALAAVHGAADERPALRTAWRALLQNQAHDSIGGCSVDRVHEQMQARYDTAEELGTETALRSLERIAGLGIERQSPWDEAFDVAVFNPSPHPRTDVVSFALAPNRWVELRGGRGLAVHPWVEVAATVSGYTVDGRPAHLVSDDGADRIRCHPDLPARSVEFVATDVPAFGWKRYRLAPSGPHLETVEGGGEIATDVAAVAAAPDGRLILRLGDRTWTGLAALEDVGDRGDAYDFDPVDGGRVTLESVRVRRVVEPSGVRRLLIRRVLAVPAGLAPDRRRRSAERVPLVIETDARLVPGLARLDLRLRTTNTARDHRLRLLFPTGEPAPAFHAATTFDVARRETTTRDASRWVHPAPATFPHQGFVAANGLTIVAPGLPDAEVTAAGVIAVTLVRAVGWLARMDLTTRPQPAGPLVPAPGAQCQGAIEASLWILAGMQPRGARDAELGLRAVAAGEAPLVPPDRALLTVVPDDVLVSAFKPAVDRGGIVLRLLNPTDVPLTARVSVGFPVAEATPIRLDETPDGPAVAVPRDGTIALPVPAHALRSVRLDPPAR